MSKNNYISAVCSIDNGVIELNNTIDYKNQTDNAVDFLKSAYKHYHLNYPKFYKMDNLCKLALLASDVLLKKHNMIQNYAAEDIAIIIANSASSLEIDKEHQSTINDKKNYFPSPANFVYTLPNILIGEIAIRNRIKGENTFFIFDKFDTHFMISYVNSLLDTGKAKACIAGWIDFYENNYLAHLYLVEQKENGIKTAHTAEQLTILIN